MNKWIGMLMAGGLALVCASSGFAETLGVTVDGVDVGAGSGPGWTCDGSNVTVNGSGPFVLSGTSTVARFFVPPGVEAHLVLSNLYLDHSTRAGVSPFHITNGASAFLTLAGSNYFRSGNGVSAILLPDAAALTFTAGSKGILVLQAWNNGGGIGSYAGLRLGTLNIAGGDIRAWGTRYAAICGMANNERAIDISGGSLFAQGGQFARGIGQSGYGGEGVNGTLNVSGGKVLAIGGQRMSGIGGTGWQINISGGDVESVSSGDSGFPSSGIQGTLRMVGGTLTATGRGLDATPDLESAKIDGGSVYLTRGLIGRAPTNTAGTVLHELRLNGFAAKEGAAVAGLPEGYGAHDLFADTNGTVHLWLPAGAYDIAVNDTPYCGIGGSPGSSTVVGPTSTGIWPCGWPWIYPMAATNTHVGVPLVVSVPVTGDPAPALRVVTSGTTASAGYELNSEERALTYTPPLGDVGFRRFVLLASNSVGTMAQAVDVQVDSVPVFSNVPSQTAQTAMAMSFKIFAYAYPLATYALADTTSASGYSFDAARGILTYSAPAGDVGAVAFTFTASNAYGVATQTVPVSVTASSSFGVTVNGEDVSRGAGAGWSCAWPEVILGGAGDYRIKGSNAAARLVFSGEGAKTATISNLYVKNILATNRAPVSLVLQATNRIADKVQGWDGSQVTLSESSTGQLRVQWGIHIVEGVTLTIAGGHVLVNALYNHPSIGGPGGRVNITGGLVDAYHDDPNLWAAGIGGVYNSTAPVVHISGGTVRAEGRMDIGMGWQGTPNQVTFTGGSIVGLWSNSVVPAPTNAAGEAVFPLTLTGLPRSQPVAFKGLPENYGTKDVETDAAGKVYLWLPAGAYAFYANDAFYAVEDFAAARELAPAGFRPVFAATPALRLLPGQTGTWAVAASGAPAPDVALLAAETTATAGTYAFDAARGALTYVPGVADVGERIFVFRASNSLAVATQIVSATVLAPVGVTVDGQDVVFGAGPGWTFDGTNIVLRGAARFCLAGAGAAVGVRVPSGTTNAVVASNLTLEAGAAAGLPAVHVEPGAATEWILLGSNRLVSGAACAGMEIAGGAAVVFKDNSTGELTVAGGAGGAGLGFVAGSGEPGRLDVAGGRIAALGGSGGGAGLGGAGAGLVRITGGRLAAQGDAAGGIGLGGLSTAGGSSLDLSGGTVTVAGGSGALAVGWTTGAEPSGTLAIRGGSLDAGGGSLAPAPTNAAGQTVHNVILLGLEPLAPAVIDGLPAEYGTGDIHADVYGNVYLWLPAEDRVLFANDAIYLVPAGSATRTVAPGGDRPAFAAAPEPFILAGTTGSFQIAVSGADSLELVSTEAEPDTYSFDAASGLATYVPPAGSSGLRAFSFAATNVVGAATQTVWVRIMPAPPAEILIQAISEPDRYGDFSLQLGPGYAGLAVRLETASEAAGSPPEWIWEPCGQFVVGMDGVLSGVPFAHDVQFYRIRSE